MNKNNETYGNDREKIDNVQNGTHNHSQYERNTGADGKDSFHGQQKSGDMHSCGAGSTGSCGCGSTQPGAGSKMEEQNPGGKQQGQPHYGEKNRNETGYLDPEKGNAAGRETGSSEQK